MNRICVPFVVVLTGLVRSGMVLTTTTDVIIMIIRIMCSGRIFCIPVCCHNEVGLYCE